MENKENSQGIFSVALSAYLPIDIKPSIGKKWTLNGLNNSNYKIINDTYDDSPTNASIINAIHSYIVGEGLIDTNAESDFQQVNNVAKHLSKKDLSQICLDYELFGAYALQVIWNAATKPEDKKPILVKYFKVFKLGLNLNDEMEVDGYWYSFDWDNHGKYVPVFYPKYDGRYKGEDVELIVFQRPSNKDFFSQPDWISGLEAAQTESAIKNWGYNHVKNGFQGTKQIIFNDGIPPTEEIKRKITSEIQSNLQGSRNANKWWVCFSKTPETAPQIVDIPITELNQQYVELRTNAKESIITAHGATNFPLIKPDNSNGLSNNADEIEMQTAMMYRSKINPMREAIIEGLSEVFMDIDPTIKLKFRDFSTFKKDTRDIVTDNNNETQITE